MVVSGDEAVVTIPQELPLIPVRDAVVYPNTNAPIIVAREETVATVHEALSTHRYLFLVSQMNPSEEHPTPQTIYRVGTVASIIRHMELPEGRVQILVQGLHKGVIEEYTQFTPFFKVRVSALHDSEEGLRVSRKAQSLMKAVKEKIKKLLPLKDLPIEAASITDNIQSPGKLADMVAANLKLKISEAQAIFEADQPLERLRKVDSLLMQELEVSTMQAQMQSGVSEEVSKSQREYFLRQQMEAIMQELGEVDEKLEEMNEYRKKIRKARMPAQAHREAVRQLARLGKMHQDTAESSVVRTYLDWLVELPWKKHTVDNLDIAAARKVLDEDHYGLENIKERILEYLAIRKLKKKTKGPILCFIGPPGVGKTSLGRSIARALGRKFIRISLGGVRDEAEIRGHRRTYVGALPGRIIQGVKETGVNNPVFMIDEIDKIGVDFRGDPSSALLEVLDPEQNSNFSDHYLNLTFDLSKVMFVCTGNVEDGILPSLRDRMEIIDLSGYTMEEKFEIANRYLIPRQLDANGLTTSDISISCNALNLTISQYTKEAGLRNLERELASLCRKVARKKAEGSRKKMKITETNLHHYLGPPRFLPEEERKKDEVGLATGLAWTQEGGETLYIEAATVSGSGNLTLTGQLGEVMRESAQAALSYARSRGKNFGLDDDFYETSDVHIHVPAGAIPKDGPSAGVTMATALVSALTMVPVNKNIAMTGEITLRGRVLPVGGLKEKTLAAMRSNINTIIIPEKNKKDLAEIPQHIRRKINFVYARTMDDILPLVLRKPDSGSQKKPRKSS